MDAERNAGTIAGSGAHMEVSSEVEKELVPDSMEVESDHKDDMPSPGQTQSKNIIGDASQRLHNNRSSYELLYASRAKQTREERYQAAVTAATQQRDGLVTALRARYGWQYNIILLWL